MTQETLQSIGLELLNKIKMIQFRKTIALLLFALSFGLNAQSNYKSWPDVIRKHDAAWFGTEEAKKVAENVLLYQRNIGGWPKNIANAG